MITKKDLTKEQTNAFNYVMDFLNSDDQQMLLSGYAGTGKSTLVKIILDEIDEDYEVICTAPTNEAVRVLSSVTGYRYNRTIYSLLGLVLLEVDDKPPKLQPNGKNRIPDYDVVIIDESSMIQEELFEKLQYQTQINNIKIIYIGDNAQLPPVQDKGKDSKVFELSNSITLTEVQRTAKDNPIIKMVTDIRNNLDSTNDVFLTETQVHNNMGVIFYNDIKPFLRSAFNDFLSDDYKKDNTHVRVLAYRNASVDLMNTFIRKEIFGKDDVDDYEVNENLIVGTTILGKTIYKRRQNVLHNIGERLKVTKTEIQTDISNKIKYWSLMVKSEHTGHSNYIKVVHKDSLNMYKLQLKQYADIAKEHIKKKNYKGNPWASYFAFKNTYSIVKYSYATTSHKAQGSTFKNVYVLNKDCDTLKWNHIERNKLKYVAFTRASHKLHIL